ncbi:uncharacterized protein NEPG_00637 [Nematocida parisii ERTm1]|uniref:Uncharacterized protein n=1 Tax=Nematocida parisii (strain ERTm3) TaxID=935791 RepID=I3ED92_NEMP3|nr:uncharacterized protein NEPG_00637 [Nematocida parisii ERTm1]EIJ87189.1 hypothetical protein NEQG_02524 [Nematocida parisii ERTm3]KAI5126577.1 hypothetical protein NEPAR08_0496 [Nematocida parisii]EIJ95112.1 hypothetical protein NEPG_00637 [Nematocida parisii ERTm1]KAI5129396.1 hypothetical protein NEPAR03_1654 [Nematocida parisii]KAI5142209.1 hypothetical protein NEPAR04_1455 [Nematocida parisii]|eukprot:XP_013058468.1 hypothetical protein NEPG_00637 [Nematocida parisii ERTm1]
MIFSIITKLLLVAYTVCARSMPKEIKDMHETLFGREGCLVAIHPDGPLSPFRGYIMHKTGYMYNKRLYAPEIDTEYSLKPTNEVADNGGPIYKYIRDPAKDRPYTDICEDLEKNEYLKQFHTQLIRMFSFAEGSLSIVADREDALYSFLKRDEVQPQSMYILAALFLLSEKVNIPIVAELEEGKEKLVLKSKDEKTTYVTQSLVLYEDMTRLKKGEKNYHTETVDIIAFLRRYIDNPHMHGLTEPISYKQFMSGEFLSTPQFLIQSYIYEFVGIAGRYIEFVNAVHTLLTEQIDYNDSGVFNAINSVSQRDSYVFEKCFIEKEDLSSAKDHITSIYEYSKMLDSYDAFPFITPLQLPHYKLMSTYSRDTDTFILDDKRMYFNCSETVLLGLLCCLVYDPEMRAYTTEHLPKASKPLKDFFRKYSKPVETTGYEMQQDWCRVVADLKSDKILYRLEGGNLLGGGLLNILYVLAEVAGESQEACRTLNYIEKMCCAGKISNPNDIEEYLTNMLRSLSKNKNLIVESNKLILNMREDTKHDVFGGIKLMYTANGIKHGIFMDIRLRLARFVPIEDLLSSENDKTVERTLTEIQSAYSDPENYIECLIGQYIGIELGKTDIWYIQSRYLLNEKIQACIKDNSNSVYSLFILGKIDCSDYVVRIITYFLPLYRKEYALSENSPLVRFTSNIIGSVPLDNPVIREDVLIGHHYSEEFSRYYPRIEIY